MGGGEGLEADLIRQEEGGIGFVVGWLLACFADRLIGSLVGGGRRTTPFLPSFLPFGLLVQYDMHANATWPF